MSVFRLLGETPNSMSQLDNAEKVDRFEGAISERNLNNPEEKNEPAFISTHLPEGNVALWLTAGVFLGVVAVNLYR